jgi:hypothetical protein
MVWLVRNLGSRSFAVRERSTRLLMRMGREEAVGVLEWGKENMRRDVEVRRRIEAIMAAMWLEEGR